MAKSIDDLFKNPRESMEGIARGRLRLTGSLSVVSRVRPVDHMVREFHAMFGYPIGQPLALEPRAVDHLEDCAKILRHAAHQISHRGPGHDYRTMRMYLMIEELAEMAEAMARADFVLTADAVADLGYVVAGTAVSFGMPYHPLLEEVHRSNMTKERTNSMKPAKGRDWSPPNIRGILGSSMF